MIELHGVKYYIPREVSQNIGVTQEFVQDKIDSGELESCLIDEVTYVSEDSVLEYFTEKNKKQ
jgi:hypothetical protein